MHLLFTLAAFAVAIGVLVAVHEYGHYWVAKRCNVKILTFSIGFGTPIKVWQRGETLWQLAAIPLGGYVKMLDEREAPVADNELHRAFNRQSVARRMAIVVAGPVANLLLAILLYWVIFVSGVVLTAPKIGSILPASQAAQAGLVAGDTVAAINGKPVESWSDVKLALVDAASANTAIDMSLLGRNGEQRQAHLDFSHFDKDKVDGDTAERIGMSLAVYLPRLGKIEPGGVAASSAMREGDGLVAVNGQATPDWLSFSTAIRALPGKPALITLNRGGQPVQVQITPRAEMVDGKLLGRIGIHPAFDEAAMQALNLPRSYGPVPALGLAVRQTWETATLSVRMMWRMVMGQVSVKQISGPVAIAGYAGQTAKLGLRPYLEFLCMISISLGVLNLLPIPVLDGGHLLYYSAELLRGRPLSERAMELGQRVGVGILAVLMSVALFNDISRLVGS
ncbi:RIP metalloprotease RseP [Chitinimonas sp.]|uniref:RIP metalloprotease RseP n=1 Tax=Chitinimonas sp. TaxID=1934313 RepID=UPI0035AF32C9